MDLTDSYYQENSSTPLIKQPDMNTNMFTDYGTSLFSMYLYLTGIIIHFFLNLKYLTVIDYDHNFLLIFLIGDLNALSNWDYKDNPSMVIFNGLILFGNCYTIYLMNLFIGLLTKSIEEDDNRACITCKRQRYL